MSTFIKTNFQLIPYQNVYGLIEEGTQQQQNKILRQKRQVKKRERANNF